jgi:hypothetical protein
VGPDDSFCDAVTRANGRGFISCLTNNDCDINNIGIAAGACTLTERRACFVAPITATGAATPTTSDVVATACAPATSNGSVNSVVGLPGAQRIVETTSVAPICANGSGYTSGGSCP